MCQLILASLTIASVNLPAQQAGYGAGEQFDLHRIPFSRYGSYLSFRQLTSDGKPGALEGLFLRTVHGNVPQQELLRLTLTDGRNEIPFQAIGTPTLLTLKAATGEVEIYMPTPERIRIRLRGVWLQLERPGGTAASDNSFATWAEPVDGVAESAHVWDYTASPQDLTLRLSSIRGGLHVVNTWNGEASDNVSFSISPDSDGAGEASIEEFSGTYHADDMTRNTMVRHAASMQRDFPLAARESSVGKTPGKPALPTFEEELATLRATYSKWISKLPAVPAEMQATANLAAYVDWSSVVEPLGHLTRPTMLMSKVNMTAVWSWDHCFNAMALATADPQLAWDQFMWVFDTENADGISPDLMTDRWLLWSFSKPPIHGLTMAYLEKANPAFFSDPRRLAELYPKLARRTEWYFRYRNWDHRGLPQYNHGNDSGWDNSTVFRTLPPAETPDLAAFLVLQMEELARIAKELNRQAASNYWQKRANALRSAMLKRMWREDRFVALHLWDQSVIDSDSLLLYMPIVLGASLPKEVRNKLVDKLKEPGHFLTEYGLASEPLASPYFVEDGYWRGAIWASPTLLIVEGLDAAGEHEFANDLRRRFCKLVMKSGFAENFGAHSGAAQRDPAYTWTASVFLIFAHELELESRTGSVLPSRTGATR